MSTSWPPLRIQRHTHPPQPASSLKTFRIVDVLVGQHEAMQLPGRVYNRSFNLSRTRTVLLRLMLRIPPPICEALSVTSPRLRVHDWYAAITLTAYQFDHSLCRLQPRFEGSTHIRWLADATLILIYVCPRQICTVSAVSLRCAIYKCTRLISESAI